MKLSRVTQYIFGSSAGSDEISQFGSLAAGSPEFTTNLATIQSLSQYLEGWFAGVISGNSPAIEDMNALFYLTTTQLSYLFQEGIPEYDSNTVYYQYSVCQTSGTLYQATYGSASGFSGIQPPNGSYWTLLSALPAIANDTVLGNTSGSSEVPGSLTGSQITALLSQFTTSAQGVVPGSGGGNSNFLRADGSWAVPLESTGTVDYVGMTVPAFLSVSGTPITGSGVLAVSYSGSAIPVANGGTGETSNITTPTPTTIASWDANENLSANNFAPGFTSIATTGGTTTLTVASSKLQYLTGSLTQTVQLPAVSTLPSGFPFYIYNTSSSTVTVRTSGSATLQTMASNTQLELFYNSTSGSSTLSWNWLYTPNIAYSVTSSTFSTASTTFTNITGSGGSTITASIISTGKPCKVYLTSDATGSATGNTAGVVVFQSGSTIGEAVSYFLGLRNGNTVVGQTLVGGEGFGATIDPLFAFQTPLMFVDQNPPLGTNAYTMQARVINANDTVEVNNCIIVAEEIH
jgi:hypothetical protein